MADTKNELMNEDDRVIVTLEDETGEKVDYEFLDVIEYDNEEYLILTKFNPNIDSDVYDVVIFLINPNIGVQGVQTRLKRNVRFESK